MRARQNSVNRANWLNWKNAKVNFDLILFASFFSSKEKNEVGFGAKSQTRKRPTAWTHFWKFLGNTKILT